MTQREIKSYLSKNSWYPACRIDVMRFCQDFGFRPYDVDHIQIVNDEYCFIFKDYFKREELKFTHHDLFVYVIKRG